MSFKRAHNGIRWLSELRGAHRVRVRRAREAVARGVPLEHWTGVAVVLRVRPTGYRRYRDRVNLTADSESNAASCSFMFYQYFIVV